MLSPSLRCAACGTPAPSGARFCIHCGQPVAGSTPAVDPMAAWLPSDEPAEPFSLNSPLERFAVASIEWLTQPADDPERLRSLVQSRLRAVLEPVWATIERMHPAVCFVAFRDQPSPQQSVRVAVDQLCRLLADGLPIRCGVDVESGQDRNPLAGVTERALAPVGGIYLSQAAYETLLPSLAAEPAAFRVLPPAAPAPVPVYQVLSLDAPASPVPLALPPARLTPPERTPEAHTPPELRPQAPALLPPEPASPAQPLNPPPEPAAVRSLPAERPSEPLPSPRPPVEPPPPEPQASITLPEPPRPAAPPEPPVAMSPGSPPPLPPPPTEWMAGERLQGDPLPWSEATGVVLTAVVDWARGLSQILETNAQLAQAAGGTPAMLGKVFWLRGVPGVGTSTVLSQAGRQWAEAGLGVCRMGASRVAGHRVPLGLWLSLAQQILDLPPDLWSPEPVRGLLGEHLDALCHGLPDELSHVRSTLEAGLADLLSLSPLQAVSVGAAQQADRLASILGTWLSLLARQQPLVLLVEDLEAVAPVDLALLAQVWAHVLPEAPIAWVVTSPPNNAPAAELFEVWQHAAGPVWDLEAMTPTEARAWLDQGPLGGHLGDWPAEAVQALIHAGHGSPMALEEILRLLFAEGQLLPGPPVTVTPAGLARLLDGHLDGLDTLIEARFPGQFPAEAVYIAQVASVLGETVSLGLLHSLSQLEMDPFQAMVTVLVEEGIFQPVTPSVVRFRHTLIQRVVYASLPDGLRAQLHALALQAVCQVDEWVTHPGWLMAQALATGQVPACVDAAQRLMAYAVQAGWLPAAVQAIRIALEALSPVLEAPEPDPVAEDTVRRLVETLGVLTLQRDPPLSATALSWLVAQVRLLGDQAKCLEALGYLARAYSAQGRIRQALHCLDEACALFSPADFPREAAAMATDRADLLWRLGALGDLKTVAASIPHAHQTPRLRLLAAMAALESGSGSGAFDSLLDAGLEDPADPFLPIMAVPALLLRGRLKQAHALLQETLPHAEDDPEGRVAWGLAALAVHAQEGEWDAARLLLPSVLYPAEQLGLTAALAWVQVWAGRVAWGLKDPEAGSRLEMAIAFAEGQDLMGIALTARRFWMDWALDTGQPEAVLAVAEALRPQLENPGLSPRVTGWWMANLEARARVLQGEAREAGRQLEPIWPLVQSAGAPPLVAATAATISMIYQAMADEGGPSASRYAERAQAFRQKARTLWWESGMVFELNRLS